MLQNSEEILGKIEAEEIFKDFGATTPDGQIDLALIQREVSEVKRYTELEAKNEQRSQEGIGLRNKVGFRYKHATWFPCIQFGCMGLFVIGGIACSIFDFSKNTTTTSNQVGVRQSNGELVVNLPPDGKPCVIRQKVETKGDSSSSELTVTPFTSPPVGP